MDREAWQKFIDGHWTLAHPTKTGTYPTATRDGVPCGASSWALAYKHPGTGVVQIVSSWGGYFWSEPLPELPAPPVVP